MRNTICVTQDNLYTGNLILVNAGFPLRTAGQTPLVPVAADVPAVLLQREAAEALRKALDHIGGRSEIVPVSGYRAAGEQAALYHDCLRENGAAFTQKFVARPNHSEHQTGLAIDLALRKADIDLICPDFPDSGICAAFRRAAPDFGFVERYPDSKSHITGIGYEPWHFRYVGIPHAVVMTQNKFTLEEYIAFLRQFPYGRSHLRFRTGRAEAEIFAVAPGTALPAADSFSGHARYEVSGDNTGSLIVTLWRCRDV